MRGLVRHDHQEATEGYTLESLGPATWLQYSTSPAPHRRRGIGEGSRWKRRSCKSALGSRPCRRSTGPASLQPSTPNHRRVGVCLQRQLRDDLDLEPDSGEPDDAHCGCSREWRLAPVLGSHGRGALAMGFRQVLHMDSRTLGRGGVLERSSVSDWQRPLAADRASASRAPRPYSGSARRHFAMWRCCTSALAPPRDRAVFSNRRCYSSRVISRNSALGGVSWSSSARGSRWPASPRSPSGSSMSPGWPVHSPWLFS